jgi:hypothetical protein
VRPGKPRAFNGADYSICVEKLAAAKTFHHEQLRSVDMIGQKRSVGWGSDGAGRWPLAAGGDKLGSASATLGPYAGPRSGLGRGHCRPFLGRASFIRQFGAKALRNNNCYNLGCCRGVIV